MNELDALLDRFESVLFGHIGHVLDVAATSPAGGAGRWEDVLGHFGLQGMPREERGPTAARRGQPRGAFPEEVERVLQSIVMMAHASLSDLQTAYGRALQTHPSAGARVSALTARLAGIVAEQREAYERQLRAKPSGTGVAAIFANARATAEISPWKNWTLEYQRTLQCPGCGAAQQAELVFTCKYCGGNLFGEHAE